MSVVDAEVEVRKGQEGSRWYNQRPSAEQVAEWFKTVPLHDDMEHADYVGGITLIVQKEKSNWVAGFDAQGLPNIVEREDLVYVPYIKVETRVAYFWKLMELHPDWLGVIEPVPATGGDPIGLPPGFFKYAAAKPQDQKVVSFVGCSYRVGVYERMVGRSGRGSAVIEPAAGTKIVSTATKWDVDQNAVMKAETGAIGRALGMAGMLVIPGSGVATAEDMLDATVQAGSSDPVQPQLPEAGTDEAAEPAGDDALRARAELLVVELGERSPAKLEAFQEWARGRKLTLASAQGAVLRGAVRKLEREVDGLDRETSDAR